jgi:hypothetical protein
MVNKRKSPLARQLDLMKPDVMQNFSSVTKPRYFTIGPQMLDIIHTLMPQPDNGGCASPTPLVCSRSRILFMLPSAAHVHLQGVLSDIYYPDDVGVYVSDDIRQSRWSARGCGWWVSSMRANTIVVHENYRITDYDAPVFEIWRHIQKETFEYQ